MCVGTFGAHAGYVLDGQNAAILGDILGPFG
jgi:hypothetical protein